MTSTTDIPIEVDEDDIAAQWREIILANREQTARIAEAFRVIQEETNQFAAGCKWPMIRTTWAGGDWTTECGRGVNGDPTYGPTFCWQHEKLMLRHVADLLDRTVSGVPVDTMEQFATALLAKMREQSSAWAGRHGAREWMDWIDTEIARRLRENDMSTELRRKINDYIEDALAKKWSMS